MFLKEHLLGMYDWKHDAGQLSFDGEVTRRLFNRCNGSQVLFIINFFLLNIDNSTIENGRKAELLIIEKLPFGTKSEMSVLKWLLDQNLDTVKNDEPLE